MKLGEEEAPGVFDIVTKVFDNILGIIHVILLVLVEVPGVSRVVVLEYDPGTLVGVLVVLEEVAGVF